MWWFICRHVTPNLQESLFNPDDEPTVNFLKYFQLGRISLQDWCLSFFSQRSALILTTQIDQSSVNLPWFSW